MHWAQKIAIAKEAREAGRWMREPWEEDNARLAERLNAIASRTWEGTLDLTNWKPAFHDTDPVSHVVARMAKR